MTALQVQVGSTITNGSIAVRVTERVERNTRWGVPGWQGLSIPLEQFGGNPGLSEFVPDYLLSGWYHVPFEWRPVVGGSLEERYVWAPGWRYLQREVRRVVQPTVNGIRGHRMDTPVDAALRDALGVGEPITRADAKRLMAELGVDELDLVQRQDHDIRGDY
jgi:hypothetical protein